MTPNMELNIVRSLQLHSNATSNPSSQEEKGISSPNADIVLTKDSTSTAVDTVSISSQLKQTITDVNIEVSKKEEANILKNSGKSDRAAAKVEFVYDQNGDLITKFMDTANRLVYQTPSELMLHLKETASKSNSSLDTKA